MYMWWLFCPSVGLSQSCIVHFLPPVKENSDAKCWQVILAGRVKYRLSENLQLLAILRFSDNMNLYFGTVQNRDIYTVFQKSKLFDVW